MRLGGLMSGGEAAVESLQKALLLLMMSRWGVWGDIRASNDELLYSC